MSESKAVKTSEPKSSGAICWPEQFPGEYEMSKKVWDNADKKWPGRRRECTCRDNEDGRLCNHCPICGRFMSDMTCWSNEIGGLLAVVGQCKIHGEQCADDYLWSYTEWEPANA